MNPAAIEATPARIPSHVWPASRRGERELGHPGVDEGHGEHGHQGRDRVDPGCERGHAERDRDQPEEHEQPPPAGRLPRLLGDVPDRMEQGISKLTGRLVCPIGLLRFHSFLQSIPARWPHRPGSHCLSLLGRRSRRRSHRHGNWRLHVMSSSGDCSFLGLTACVGTQPDGRMSGHPPNRMDMASRACGPSRQERRAGGARMSRRDELRRRARRSWWRRLRQLALTDRSADTGPR